MKRVKPGVFLLSSPEIDENALGEYLEWLGALEWESDAPSDAELIPEVAGRLCYRSFAPGLNPNVKKVRGSNKEYLEHILEVGHGSVLEHGMLTFIIVNASRVFTHELVRHRVGVGISQESLRFVRLTDLSFWEPEWALEDTELQQRNTEIIRLLEEHQDWLAKHFGLDESGIKFEEKKKKTSYMRRFAPIGLATSICWSCNFRTLRHVIEMRTHPAAEEEIRLIFGMIAKIAQERYPNIFGDYEVEIIDNLPHYKTPHRKV
ncbi:MAG: thymidylate synthase (FAD) [Candidatus Harrisonbacteria bacterium CG10_big_fil_rev_8_21_14_0_10_40_38]|uniref:FAD-dependent thymidylate synthase n=1 Tax=Candidatus Harrisonbacteria bacterium CG10_big_fil_rev_8_21_14_0_10_40_38 TaxID=1974583 RepID=A0A2H0UT37_9BACT|nr:MAG: thymidylate synthase (FAD) [Candidatus Harrisonbacteria bacterium CG10_big_fil_rev_8_21_14_0_10_40_38]